jgi:LmbE family N-acetylglucosaminyl deacetylase
VLVLAIVILGVCCFSVIVALFKAARRRTSIYWYDVSRDQSYNFSRSSLSQVTRSLQNGQLEVPSPMHGGGIVLLELRIRPMLLGLWFEPYIELESTQGRSRQPFERGGSGVRYIELSQLVHDDQTSLRLTAHYLKLRNQSVVLHYLRRDVDLDHQKILVLGTHPDDAEIAAFGVYADRDAYVVTVTAGEAGETGPFGRFGGASAYQEKGRNRAWNSVTVPMLGGLSIHRTVNLGYFDGTLQLMRQRPETPVRSLHAEAEFLDAFGRCQDTNLIEPRCNRSATWANLVADLEHLVKTIQPDIVVTPYPRLDAHPDHKLSTVALIEALKNLNWRHGSLLLYTNHLPSSDRYPFGEAGDLVGLPAGIDDVFFEGIVSIPLDSVRQARKHMALDAMIDLRPNIQIDSLRSVATTFKKTLTSTLSDGTASYLRRAVRANELFFTVKVSSLFEPGVTEKILG